MFITLSQFRVEGDGAAFDEWMLPLAGKMRALPGNIFYRFLHDARDPQARYITKSGRPNGTTNTTWWTRLTSR